MGSEQDWKFDKKKASKALQELSCHILNPFNDDNVFELVRVITYCMDLEKQLDKACEQLEKFDDRLVEYNIGDSNEVMAKEEWKEWCKENAQ
ncbi:hypothetical protein [Thomasclavelia ramosa]|uniref:hypothetical protein n=1 Tax=Thomasclavelia ramosa TaxID=1547 RepID=UPI000E4FEAE4|nr:hypothetical protein [Thomasclavelia ramosa]RGT23169.1 hypothetical protein DWX42_11495 [Thomasclavelia ramosa]